MLKNTNPSALTNVHFPSFCKEYKAALQEIEAPHPCDKDGNYILHLDRPPEEFYGLESVHINGHHGVFLSEVSSCPICLTRASKKLHMTQMAMALMGHSGHVELSFTSNAAQRHIDQTRQSAPTKLLIMNLEPSTETSLPSTPPEADLKGDITYDSDPTEGGYLTPGGNSNAGSVYEEALEHMSPVLPAVQSGPQLSSEHEQHTDDRVTLCLTEGDPSEFDLDLIAEAQMNDTAAAVEAARIVAEREKARRKAEAQARKNAEAAKVEKRKAKKARYKANKKAEAGGTKSGNESDDENSTYDFNASRSERGEISPSLDTQGSVAQTITPLLSPANSNRSLACEHPSDPLPRVLHLHISNPPKLPPWPPKEPEIIAPFKRSQTTPAFLENSVEGTGLGDGSATPQPIREKPQVRRTKSFSWNYDSENSTASNVTLSEATSIFVYEEDDSDPALRLSLIKHL